MNRFELRLDRLEHARQRAAEAPAVEPKAEFDQAAFEELFEELLPDIEAAMRIGGQESPDDY